MLVEQSLTEENTSDQDRYDPDCNGLELLRRSNARVLSIEQENFCGQWCSDIDFIGPVGHGEHADADHEGKVKHFLNLVPFVLFTTILDLFIGLLFNLIRAFFTSWQSINSLDLRCAE